jgi:paraquat-inducible protein A
MKKYTKDKLTRCHICEAVNLNSEGEVRCRRCNEKIHEYEYVSLNRTVAFLITAIILYIPANIYPILITKKFGVVHENSILGGVMHLWEAGSYPIAIIILLASVFVPILKFIFITYLLISTKYSVKSSIVDKHKLFYITEIIGSWSMVDVFVVAILSVLIHFSAVEIIPGSGASAFALMVFFTMLSALSFDTRLIKK